MIKTFKEWKKNLDPIKDEAFKKYLDAQQMGFGKLYETNFIKVAKSLCDKNEYVRVDKVSQDIDIYFGADIKITYADNMSIYCDITCNKKKKNMYLHNRNVYTTSNGAKISFGFKSRNRFFSYSKPVLIIYMDCANIKQPFFSEEDLVAILYAAKRQVEYLSYEFKFTFDGKEIIGGKRASEIICTNAGRINMNDLDNR